MKKKEKENLNTDIIRDWELNSMEKIDIDALIQVSMTDDLFISIPEDFADKMEKKAQQINLYRFWQEELLKHASLFGGAILMLAIPFGVFYYFQPESVSGILSFLDKFKWLLLSGIILVFGIQLADSWVGKKLGISENGYLG